MFAVRILDALAQKSRSLLVVLDCNLKVANTFSNTVNMRK